VSDDGPDATLTNAELANWLRSAVCAAKGEFIPISRLAALLIVERLDGGSRRGRGRPKKIGPKVGEKTYQEDMDLLFSFWGFREQFENNNESAPVERAYKAVAEVIERGEITPGASSRKIKVASVKKALNRAVKRTGHSLRVPRVPGR
jgi:hypothetical protein